ncbi:hypothetical protein [Chitinophaga ginsengisegetis]|uniref:hypothetical protein n=1 Tax=Chitinophaga ginsengisegetis TaxID=393003 RepID=UPI000DB9682E|nr:hypothetical protein [Chitinophaga ginsengisegetis]MDR6565597.1 hypothetical protein [Chitinophaga ginsengisegetis]MDR6645326.1 hypothetical protein [Chitinophaga ginsengisegetis]MDR6652083.1 hypothetical protein [Chitinophaga ginsengisegetis]
MDPLKSAWDNAPTPSRNISAIIGKHTSPVLKDIRKQVILEAIGYTIFLVVYYDFFDGDKKPFYLNLLLVISVLCMLAQSVTGYVLARQPAVKYNLLESMRKKLHNIRKYAVISIFTKILAFAGIFAFFLVTIRWTQQKYLILIPLVIIMVVQAYFQWKIWAGRIYRVRQTLEELNQ